MTTPRVTIGLPVYNGAKYLAEAIESALAQTYTDFELVISDNASADATAEICRDYAARDRRVRYVRAAKNGGAAWNFNRTFELSESEYFKWLAHDDLIGPEYLGRCVALLDREPNVVLCHTRTGIINAQGDLVGDDGTDRFETWDLQGVTERDERRRLQMLRSAKPHERYTGLLLYSIRNHEVFGVIRRSQMAKTALHRAYTGGEKAFLSELCLRGELAEVPEMLAFSRWHDERFSANPSAQAQALHMNPSAKRRPLLPRQVRATYGYLQSILWSEIGVAHRAGCLVGLGRFLMQAKKWKAVLTDYVGGTGQLATVEFTSPDNGPMIGRHWSALHQVPSGERV